MARLEDDINNDGSLSAGLEQARQQALDIQATINDPNRDTGQGNQTTGQDATSGGDNAFMSALQSRLIGQGGIVSSTDTDLEAEINRAVDNVGASRDATAQRIESRFGDAIAGAQQTGAENITAQREGSGGFATQMARVRQITGQTDERISDLERQREEALLSNNAQAASQISDLIVKEKQMEQQARQNAISNLFSGAQLQQSAQQFGAEQGLQQQQLQQQEEELEFNQSAQRIQFLNENNLLEDTSAQQKRQLEQQFGLPTNSLDNVSPDEELNLQSVSGVGLVNIKENEDGTVSSEVVVPSRQTGGGSLSVSETNANRVASTQATLDANTTETGNVTVEGYNAARNQYTATGGSLDDFLMNFPPNLFLDQKAVKNLPDAWKAYNVDTGGGGTDNEVIAE